LDGDEQQSVITPPGPRRAIGRREQGFDFRLGEEGHDRPLESLGQYCQHARDGGRVLGMAECRVAKQRVDSGKPSVAGAHTVSAIVLEMVQERANKRYVDVLEVQR
jgi:hypothetical protein